MSTFTTPTQRVQILVYTSLVFTPSLRSWCIYNLSFLKIQLNLRDKEGHYIMIKGSIQEEDITIINIYAPKIGEP